MKTKNHKIINFIPLKERIIPNRKGFLKFSNLRVSVHCDGINDNAIDIDKYFKDVITNMKIDYDLFIKSLLGIKNIPETFSTYSEIYHVFWRTRDKFRKIHVGVKKFVSHYEILAYNINVSNYGIKYIDLRTLYKIKEEIISSTELLERKVNELVVIDNYNEQ